MAANNKKITIIFSFYMLAISYSKYSYANKIIEISYPWAIDNIKTRSYVYSNREKFRPYIIKTSKKAQKYMPYIMKVIKKYDVPEEIAFLPGIESSYNPRAKSHAGAYGMWQFMKPTARDYNLITRKHGDLRGDWKKSTVAGIKYIKWMAETKFDGDYHLALLAYNAGIGKVQRAIKKYHTNNFWDLIQYDNYFKKESIDYVVKFMAFIVYYKEVGLLSNYL